MSAVNILDIKILKNPAKFLSVYEFEITFECVEPLSKDLEWKLTYVGSSTTTQYDQVLDLILVGPIPVGVNKFIFSADPPDPLKIPKDEVLGVTVILLTCAYNENEFFRVGYYVYNEYDEEEWHDPEKAPAEIKFDRIVRVILAEKPRVTRVNIQWDNQESTEYNPADIREEDIDETDVISIVDDGLEGEGDEGEEIEMEVEVEEEESEIECEIDGEAEDDGSVGSESLGDEGGDEDIQDEEETDEPATAYNSKAEDNPQPLDSTDPVTANSASLPRG